MPTNQVYRDNSDDYIYVNVNIVNNRQSPPILAQFNATYSQPLLSDCEDYALSIVRFNIDTDLIPITIVPIHDPSTSATLTNFRVRLEWNGFGHTERINWVPQVQAPVPALGASQDLSTSFYYLYSVKHFINLVNIAYQAAHAALVPNGIPSSPPQFYLDESTGKINLVCEAAFYDRNAAQPINIFMNQELSKNFAHFDFIFEQDLVESPTFARFDVYSTGNNYITAPTGGTGPASPAVFSPTIPAGFYQIAQERPSYSNFSTFSGLVITSGSIPVSNEITGGGVPLQVSQVFNNVSQAQQRLNILTDFEGDMDDIFNTNTNASTITYLPTAQYRYIQLNGRGQSLSRLDLQIYWKDKYNNIYRLFLSRGARASVKILFKKKILLDD